VTWRGAGALAPLLALGCDGFRRGLLTCPERGGEGARGGFRTRAPSVGGSRQGTDLRGTQNATAISLRRRLKKIILFASNVVEIRIVFRNSMVGFSKV